MAKKTKQTQRVKLETSQLERDLATLIDGNGRNALRMFMGQMGQVRELLDNLI